MFLSFMDDEQRVRAEALDDYCRGIFKETYGETASVEWIAAWRDEYERLGKLDKEVRALCRDFDEDREENFACAVEWLEPLGVEPWSGDVCDPAFVALPPMARQLVQAVAAARAAGCPALERAFVDRTRQAAVDAGIPIPDLGKPLGFLIWAFETAVCDGPGFQFLKRRGAPRNAGAANARPSVPVPVRTFEQVWLPDRALTAIGRLLLPESFGLSLVDEVAEAHHEFEALRRSVKQAVESYGYARLATGTARTSEPSEVHPASVVSAAARRWFLDGARKMARSSLPVWLQWPDGFRDTLRDRAAKEPVVHVFPEEFPDVELPPLPVPDVAPADWDKNIPER